MCTIEETVNALMVMDFSQEEAMEIAQERKRIVEEMKNGTCEFAFFKKNGEKRIAHGTLKDIDYEFQNDESRSRVDTPLIQNFFDVDKQSWRCFKVEKLITNK